MRACGYVDPTVSINSVPRGNTILGDYKLYNCLTVYSACVEVKVQNVGFAVLSEQYAVERSLGLK